MIPPCFFRQVHSLFIKFMWAHKRPRLHHHQLSFLKQYEGLAVPNVHKYYQANHLGRFIDWCCHWDTKLWAQLEQAQSKIPLSSLPRCYEVLLHALKLLPLMGHTTWLCSHLFTSTSLYWVILHYLQCWKTFNFPPVSMMQLFEPYTTREAIGRLTTWRPPPGPLSLH